VNVIGVADAKAAVSHLVVEQNGSDFLVSWDLHSIAANVTSIALVWCASRSSVHGCEVILTFLAAVLLNIQLLKCISNCNVLKCFTLINVVVLLSLN